MRVGRAVRNAELARPLRVGGSVKNYSIIAYFRRNRQAEYLSKTNKKFVHFP